MRNRLCPIAAAILVLCCTSAALADPTPVYFDVPAGYNAGMGIAPAPDGTVWFAANVGSATPSVGRLTVSQAAPGTANGMATFPTPPQAGSGCCAKFLRSVAYDAAANRVWFVQSDGVVGYADAAAVSPGTSNGMVDTLVQTQTTSGPYAPDLWDVAIGTGGIAWFSEHSAYNVSPYPGDRIASIDSGLHVSEQGNLALQGGLSSLDDTRYDAQPEGITVDPVTGKPWFAESSPGLPGYRIATTGGAGGYAEYLITPCAPGPPCSGSYTGTGPTDVAVAHDGSIWFTNELKNEIGRLDPAGGTFTHYSLPAIDEGLSGGQARAISVAPDGTLWVAEYGGITLPSANAIVKIVPSSPTPTASVTHLGGTGGPLAVAPDTKGDVWFSLATLTGPGLIGELAGVVGGTGGGGGGGGGGGVVLKPASVGVARVGTPSATGPSVSVDQICVGPPSDPCALVYILSSGDYVDGFPNAKAASVTASTASVKSKKRKPRKPKPVVLGKKAVTLHGGQHKRITITLNAKGRALLKHAKGGKLTLYFTAEQAGAKGKPAKRLKRIRVTFRLKPAKHVKRRR
jgi:hypothetical protein